MDPRFLTYADLLVGHSTRLQIGETVIIELIDDVPPAMADALVERVYTAGARPIVWLTSSRLTRLMQLNASESELRQRAEIDLFAMKQAQAYIGIRGNINSFMASDIHPEQMKLYMKLWMDPVHMEQRVKHTKWVVNRWPIDAMAQAAEMSTPEFEDFFFASTIGVNYKKMSRAMNPLVELMNATDFVEIIGPGETNLTFSIKGIKAVKCDGERNIPDGEIYTAPVRKSVNGVICYNTKTLYQGQLFSGIRLVFKDGKIVEATCETGDQERLNAILDTDEGARYIGEFALGVNPGVTKPICDTLFDEKISGSFHFTPGNSYDEAPNGNKSAIHWDIVCMQSEASGGGEIFFDGELVRQDGLFVLGNLQGLNPDNLQLS